MIDPQAAATTVLSAAVTLQALTAVVALRMIRLTRRPFPWTVLAAGFVMMAVRRAIPLSHVLAGGSSAGPIDLASESLALLTSTAMFVGVLAMRPMFDRMRHAESTIRASERRYRQLFEAHRGVNLLVDGDTGLVVEANQMATEFYGITRDAFREHTLASLSCQAEEAGRERLARLVADGGVLPDRHRDAHGQIREVELRAGPATFDERPVVHVTVVDVTERRTAEHSLVTANEDLRRWVGELERHRHDSEIHIELNALLQSCESTGDVGQAVQRLAPALFPEGSGALYLEDSPSSMLTCTTRWGPDPPPEKPLAREDCWALRRGQLHITDEPASGLVCPHLIDTVEDRTLCLPVRSHGGMPGLLTLSGSPRLRESGGQRQARLLADTVGVAVVNLRLRDTLRDQSIRDVLTGLFNRRYFEETLERELARADRDGDSLSLLMLDLDFFKAVNDTFGHAAGDRVLQSLADLLRRHIRTGDVVCRYGGEEFAIVMPGAGPEQALERASALRRAAHSVDLPGPGPMHGVLSISAGVASFPDHARRAADLVRSADEALYAAKAAGRDCVSLPPSMQDRPVPFRV
jgi:diguanylate cyclase (GGDEF)-like protein/PAS domain S-box-containing protein